MTQRWEEPKRGRAASNRPPTPLTYIGEIQMASTLRVLQIVEVLGNAIEIADAITIGILERAAIDFIEDGMLPPCGIGGWSCGRL